MVVGAKSVGGSVVFAAGGLDTGCGAAFANAIPSFIRSTTTPPQLRVGPRRFLTVYGGRQLAKVRLDSVYGGPWR